MILTEFIVTKLIIRKILCIIDGSRCPAAVLLVFNLDLLKHLCSSPVEHFTLHVHKHSRDDLTGWRLLIRDSQSDTPSCTDETLQELFGVQYLTLDMQD